MSAPVIDQIRDQLLTTLATVTTDNGYNYDLTVELQDTVNGNVPADLKVVLYRGETKETPQGGVGFQSFAQQWVVEAFSLDTSGEDHCDERISTISADICKAVVADYQCNGLAQETRLDSIVISPDRSSCALTFTTQFDTPWGDPFTVA
jgi:hypothetical protein